MCIWGAFQLDAAVPEKHLYFFSLIVSLIWCSIIYAAPNKEKNHTNFNI